MYPRIVPRKNKDGSERHYVYLVESIRNGKKVNQKTIGSLGRLEKLIEGDQMRGLIEKLAAMDPKLKDNLIIADRDSEVHRKSAKQYGAIAIFRHVWNELGIGDVLNNQFKTCKTDFVITEAIFAMVCNRLLDPASKRGTHQWLNEVYEPNWEQLELQHLYRSMDYLVDHKSEFETQIYENSKALLKLEVDFVMFDTTSIMTWGTGENAPLLRHGHSKEKRSDLKQIMVGVLMSKDGMPIGHEVWEGNQSDKKSFVQIIQKVQTQYQLKKVILVGDRGMISSKNISELEDAGLNYILGLPMRRLSAEKRDLLLTTNPDLLSENGFKLVKATDDGKLYSKDVTLSDGDSSQRYIVCYNPNEADSQAQKRAYFKEILQQKVLNRSLKEWVVKNGYRKYLTLKSQDGSDVVVSIDEDRLAREAIFDGKWVLTTNTSDQILSDADIARAYKGLSQIELAFRELKSTLEIGPMYHWTDKRIRGHVFICFLALIIETTIKKRLHLSCTERSFSHAISHLKTLDISKITIGKKSFWLSSDPSESVISIFNSMNCSLPKRIL